MIIQKPQGILFDIDGTLTESKQPLDDEMAKLLSALLMRFPVAITSGASMKQIETQFLPNLPMTTSFSQLFLFPASGAQAYYYTHNAWQLLYDHEFTAEEKTNIIEVCTKIIAESGCTAGKTIYGKQIEDRGAEVSVSLLGQEAPIKEKELFDPNRVIRLSLIEKLIPLLPSFEIRLGGMTTIDITKKGIDKAYAVEQFATYLNVPTGRLLYVGDALSDGGNDSAVLRTDIETQEVYSLKDTRALITSIIED